MKVTPLVIEGAWLIEAKTYPDNRGLFREWFSLDLSEKADIPYFEVRQANTSISSEGVIRGIHYSSAQDGQSKIVTCTSGSCLDAIVDLRAGSRTFGKSIVVELDSESGLSVFISSGLGHGFQALEDNTAITYLLNKSYNPNLEFAINPLDPDLAIKWKENLIIISEKDRLAKNFSEIKREKM